MEARNGTSKFPPFFTAVTGALISQLMDSGLPGQMMLSQCEPKQRTKPIGIRRLTADVFSDKMFRTGRDGIFDLYDAEGQDWQMDSVMESREWT